MRIYKYYLLNLRDPIQGMVKLSFLANFKLVDQRKKLTVLLQNVIAMSFLFLIFHCVVIDFAIE